MADPSDSSEETENGGLIDASAMRAAPLLLIDAFTLEGTGLVHLPRSYDPAEDTGRDEMNVIEYPFATLGSARSEEASNQVRSFNHVRHDTNGQKLVSTWTIEGGTTLGLPTFFDEKLMIALMERTYLTHSSTGHEDRTCYFSRHQILRRMNVEPTGASYKKLELGLTRLRLLTIIAVNAWYDNLSKTHRTVNGFGLVDSFYLHGQRKGENPRDEGNSSSVIWSKQLYESIYTARYAKKLNVSFYMSLQNATAARMYRLLDKRAYRREDWRVPLKTLAYEHLGVSRTRTHNSALLQQLRPAINELIGHGFLLGTEVVRSTGELRFIFNHQFSSLAPDSPILAIPRDPGGSPDRRRGAGGAEGAERRRKPKAEDFTADLFAAPTPAQEVMRSISTDCGAAYATVLRFAEEGLVRPGDAEATQFERGEALWEATQTLLGLSQKQSEGLITREARATCALDALLGLDVGQKSAIQFTESDPDASGNTMGTLDEAEKQVAWFCWRGDQKERGRLPVVGDRGRLRGAHGGDPKIRGGAKASVGPKNLGGGISALPSPTPVPIPAGAKARGASTGNRAKGSGRREHAWAAVAGDQGRTGA